MSLHDEIRRIVRQELRMLLGSAARQGSIAADELSGSTSYLTVQGHPGASGDENIRAALLEPYGHASRPVDAVALMIKSGGQWVVVAVDERSTRPSLSAGETALYNAYGVRVHLKNDGNLILNGGTVAAAGTGDSCNHVLTAGPWTVSGSITIGDSGRPVKI